LRAISLYPNDHARLEVIPRATGDVRRLGPKMAWPSWAPGALGHRSAFRSAGVNAPPHPVPLPRINRVRLALRPHRAQPARPRASWCSASADDTIASANQFNEPPQGRYVPATIRAKYVGGGEGDPWIDMTVKYVGTDHRQYDESSCDAVVPHESYDQPTLQ
jgi:hypothetical protein